jgi:hypothetical protein
MWQILITVRVLPLATEPVLDAPNTLGSLPDQRYFVGSGGQSIDASANFVGTALTYSLSAGQPIASIDRSTGLLTISTDNAVPDTIIIVRASNSAGFAELRFNAAVDIDDIIDMTGVGHWAIGTTFMVS